ncbi:MAG: hypothetical protein A3G24_09740 [Betaproteobacteria bacterium RIFCSPLOWO2_12_FULL_62_13]|nr:MAG: hypothetical protein A3G24_09740 [Betaproteobacteria bacterium RIFCSPLOWO2_12_FULL_62_13]
MTFLWPHALWLLFGLPVLVGAYVRLLQRRSNQALRYASLSVVREAIGVTLRVRRHIPPLLFLLGITALLLAVARPAAFVVVPSGQGMVILTIDVSLSMAATDVAPTRLAAAQAAAAAFIKAQPPDVRIGIVAFGGHADVVQSPTLNRGGALAALARLELQQYTAIGTGLMAALRTIYPTANIGGEYDIFGRGRQPTEPEHISLHHAHNAEKEPPGRVPPAADLSTAIVLVSDGRGTMGVPPIKAAKMAADHGVRVYTVGVGTPYGGVANVEGWPAIHAEFEEEILKEIAAVTQGEYFHASTAGKLAKIYSKLTRRVVLERKETEITALLAAIGAVLLLVAAVLSLLWCNRFA